MGHTPLTIYAPYGQRDSIANDKGHVASCETEEEAEFLWKAGNFFHSDDGRTIDTDRIAQGGFWEMVDNMKLTYEIFMAITSIDDFATTKDKQKEFLLEIRALLDRLGVK